MSGKPKVSRKDAASVNFASGIAVGAAVIAAVYFVLIAVYAFAALKTGINASTYMPAGFFIGALSGLIGGFVAAKSVKQKGIVCGASSGLIASVFCSLVMFFVNSNKAGTGVFIFMAAMLLGGAAGGIAAMNLRIKKKY